MKNKIKSLSLKKLAQLSLPLSTAALLVSAMQVSHAATLNGDTETSFDGGFTIGVGASLATLTNNSLTFSPDLAPIALSQQSGSFLGDFNSAQIGDIQSFNNPFLADNPFLDFGSLAVIPGVVGLGGEESISDGTNIFTLDDIFFDVSQSGANVSVNIALYGQFEDELGNLANGAGNITLQTNNLSVEEFANLIEEGGSITSSFSGAVFTTSDKDISTAGLSETLLEATSAESVPEPAQAFGIALALGAGVSFKKTLAAKLSNSKLLTVEPSTSERR